MDSTNFTYSSMTEFGSNANHMHQTLQLSQAPDYNTTFEDTSRSVMVANEMENANTVNIPNEVLPTISEDLIENVQNNTMPLTLINEQGVTPSVSSSSQFIRSLDEVADSVERKDASLGNDALQQSSYSPISPYSPTLNTEESNDIANVAFSPTTNGSSNTDFTVETLLSTASNDVSKEIENPNIGKGSKISNETLLLSSDEMQNSMIIQNVCNDDLPLNDRNDVPVPKVKDYSTIKCNELPHEERSAMPSESLPELIRFAIEDTFTGERYDRLSSKTNKELQLSSNSPSTSTFDRSNMDQTKPLTSSNSVFNEKQNNRVPNEPDKHNKLDKPIELDETNEPDKRNQLDEPIELDETNEADEPGKLDEPNKLEEDIEADEPNGSVQVNERDKYTEPVKLNEPIESNELIEPNELVEPNESVEVNEGNKQHSIDSNEPMEVNERVEQAEPNGRVEAVRPSERDKRKESNEPVALKAQNEHAEIVELNERDESIKLNEPMKQDDQDVCNEYKKPDESNEPNELVEPNESVDVNERDKHIDTNEPMEVNERDKRTESVVPNEPMEVNERVEHTEPNREARPSERDKRKESNEPVELKDQNEPDESNKPIKPNERDEPEPNEPNKLDEFNERDEPKKLDEPNERDEPIEHDAPDRPNKSTQSKDTVQSIELDEPNEPKNQEEPDEPNKPDEPDKPDDPNDPQNSEKTNELNVPLIAEVPNAMLILSEDLPNAKDVQNDVSSHANRDDAPSTLPSQTICYADEDFEIVLCDDASSVSSSDDVAVEKRVVSRFEAFVCPDPACNFWFCLSKEEMAKHVELKHKYGCGLCAEFHTTRDAAKVCFFQHLGRLPYPSRPSTNGACFKSENPIVPTSPIPIRYFCPVCIDQEKPRPCSALQPKVLRRHALVAHGAVLPDLYSKNNITNYDPLTTRVFIAGTTKNYRLKRNSAAKRADYQKKIVDREKLLSLIKASKLPESSPIGKKNSLTKKLKLDPKRSETKKIAGEPSKGNPDSVSKKNKVERLGEDSGLKSRKNTKESLNMNANIDKTAKSNKSTRAHSDKNATNVDVKALKVNCSVNSTKMLNAKLSNARSKLVNARILSTKLRLSRRHCVLKTEKDQIVQKPGPLSSKGASLELSEQRYACPVCIDIGQPLRINAKETSVLRKHALNVHYVILPDLNKHEKFNPLTTRVLMADTGEPYQRTNSGKSGQSEDPVKSKSSEGKHLVSRNSKIEADNSSDKKRKVEPLYSDAKSKLHQSMNQRESRFGKRNVATNEISSFCKSGNEVSVGRVSDKNDNKDILVASAVSLLKDTIRCATMEKSSTRQGEFSGPQKLTRGSNQMRDTFRDKSHNEIRTERNLKRKMSLDETRDNLIINDGRKNERSSKRQRNETNDMQKCNVSVFKNLDREIVRSMDLERLELNELNNSAEEIRSCGYSVCSNESAPSNRNRRSIDETHVRIVARDICTEKMATRRSGMMGGGKNTGQEKNWTKNKNREIDNRNRLRDRYSHGKKDWRKDESRVKNWVNERDHEMDGWSNEDRKVGEKKEKIITRASLTSPLSVDVSTTGKNPLHLSSSKFKIWSSSGTQRSQTTPNLPSNANARNQPLSNVRREERNLRDRLSKSLLSHVGPWIADEVYRKILVQFPVEESVVAGRELMEVGQRYSEASEYIFNEAERRIRAGQDPVQAYRDVTGELLSGFY